MPHPRWQRIKELFAAASALAPEQRDALLRAQSDDTELLDEVRSLLGSGASVQGAQRVMGGS